MNKINGLKTENKLLLDIIENLNKKLAEAEEDNERLAKINAEILATMHTDSLTGLSNRRKFEEVYAHEFKRSKRYGQIFAVIMLDIDDFKKINDTFGHDVGDTVIQFVSSVIKSKLRDSDLGARWGGEEFMIILPNTNLLDARMVAERIRSEIEAHIFGAFKVTISAGISEFAAKFTAAEILKKADDALYASKRGGKNKITIK